MVLLRTENPVLTTHYWLLYMIPCIELVTLTMKKPIEAMVSETKDVSDHP